MVIVKTYEGSASVSTLFNGIQLSILLSNDSDSQITNFIQTTGSKHCRCHGTTSLTSHHRSYLDQRNIHPIPRDGQLELAKHSEGLGHEPGSLSLRSTQKASAMSPRNMLTATAVHHRSQGQS
uniref:Uncharacterized protein n=1 Tax=Oryza sativa subsp. japonica TaxID=39947 RepID=Q6K928_ORYSJ|nr:hypothetical protein [Oryza sativa Japonica Group]